MAEFNEEVNIVTLFDEENNAEDYEIIDVFEFNESVYAAVTPFQEEIDDKIPLEVTMLKVTAVDGEELFSMIEDEKEEIAAYEELIRLEEEDSDE